MSTRLSSSVLIVGGGPVGLTLALLLDRCGVDVAVIERETSPVTQSRAIWVHSRTLEIWDAIGMTALALAEGRTVQGIEMHRDGHFRAALPYDGGGISPHPHGLMLEQSRTQTLLLSLIAKTGIRFMWGTELVGLSEEGSGVLARLVDGRGDSSTIEARYVVGADGGGSTVRKLIGVDLEGGTYDSSFFLVDAIASSRLNPARSHLNFRRRSTIAVLPLPGDRHFRIIGNMPTGSGENPDGGYGRPLAEEEIQALVSANALPLSIESIGWSSTYRSHHRVASSFRKGRVLLAGDAGHLHSPAGGLGMNTGIADAANLAWKLAAVLDGGSEAILDSYSSERRGAARGVIQTSDRLFTLQASTRGTIAFVRRNLLPVIARWLTRTRPGRRIAFRALSGTYARYPAPATGQGHAGKLRTGDLYRETGIAAVDSAVYAREGHHTLLSIETHDPSWSDDVMAAAVRRGWEHVRVSGPAAIALTGNRRARLVVWVRPDRHIGMITDHVAELETSLKNLLGPIPTEGHE